MVIDLTAEHPPITVNRRPNGGVAIQRGESVILMEEAELTELIRIAQPAATSAGERYRFA